MNFLVVFREYDKTKKAWQNPQTKIVDAESKEHAAFKVGSMVGRSHKDFKLTYVRGFGERANEA